jgi:hypothetical protein
MNKDFRLALLRNWHENTTEKVIDFTRYDLKAVEPADPKPGQHTRNWSLMNRLNQKGIRPQDKPIPIEQLNADEQTIIKRRYPELIKGYTGVVLQVTTKQAPEEQAGVKRSQLVISKGSKSKEKTHLFILSGQSNMAGLNPNISFTPTVETAFGKDNVIVVKDAAGGQPIRRWYKKWKPEKGDEPKATGDLYDRLMTKVNTATKDKNIQTVTFVWMQGERDAREKHGQVYAASFKGLLDQLHADLGRKDINFVIGRLSDFDMDNKRYPHWTMVRKAQVQVAQDDPRGAWVDTDDLNDKKNAKTGKSKDDLHYSRSGYKTLGKRFAEKAIALIDKKPERN